MGVALVAVLTVLCSGLLLVAVFRLMKTLNGYWDKTGKRLEHALLAPVKRFVWFPGLDDVVRGPPCTPCGGMGVQVLLGGAWTIIPPELRDRQKDGTHPRLANTRRCPGCHGLGFKWVRET